VDYGWGFYPSLYFIKSKIKEMNNLFFSRSDNFLFWVSGTPYSGYLMNRLVEDLQRKAWMLADLVGLSSDSIQTLVVQEPNSRYKDMRVYFVSILYSQIKDISGVQHIGEDKNMWTFLNEPA
jgi:hypothetical protein